MRKMYPEVTAAQLSPEFSGFVFYGEQQPAFQPYQTDRYNFQNSCHINNNNINSNSNNNNNNIEDMSFRHYTQLNSMSTPSNAYQILNSLDNEKRKLSAFTQIKQEFEGIPYAPNGDMSNSLPDIRNLPEHDQSNSFGYSEQLFPPRSKSLSHSPSPCSPQDVTTSDSEMSPKSGLNKSSRPRMYKFNPRPLTLNPQMKRSQTPSNNKNDEYWEKRKKNNEASRRSRMARRLKECMVMEEMKKLKKENEDLKAELLKMQNAASCRM